MPGKLHRSAAAAAESEGFRSVHTLNFRSYVSEGREPFGTLLALNEEMLDPGKGIKIIVSKPVEIILIPTVGGLELVDSHGESVFVSPGETFRCLTFPESRFTIFNPYQVETINYLRIHLTAEISGSARENHINNLPFKTIDLDKANSLEPAFSSGNGNVSGFVGQYQGRKEGLYKIQNPGSSVFAYIISGAFEVQNRLLEKGDALSLLNVEELDFEALSNGAIILVMEVGME